ncbi:MAG: META domain-containing protein [Dysgonamonadaceae bacterium]|jgi:hypothetical protein|nr:META domain-containing protein [Dysgonamonadaceae bacterium]
MKTLKFFLFSMLAVSMGMACPKNNTPGQGTDNPNGEVKLTNVKWKLTSIVTGGKAKSPEQDSDNRYWLLFKDDNTFAGRSSANDISGNYKINAQTSSFLITNLGGTKIGELDGNLFMESLKAVRSFDLREGTLKLYYNETDYLFFNPYPELINPINGTWEVKMISISGILTNIGSPPKNNVYSDILIKIPNAMQGTMGGHTFYNEISIGFEIAEHQRINIKSYGGTRIAEDEWGRAFSDHIRDVVKFDISNNELKFMDSQDNPVIVFIKKN